VLCCRGVVCALQPRFQTTDFGTAVIGATMVTSTRVLGVDRVRPRRHGVTLTFPWASLTHDHLTGEEDTYEAPRGWGKAG
jgi:hypothetical protein